MTNLTNTLSALSNSVVTSAEAFGQDPTILIALFSAIGVALSAYYTIKNKFK